LFSIETNKSLTALNSLGFKATAQSYANISSEEDLLQAFEYIKVHAVNYQVLSGGSNLLIAEYVPGLTLHMKSKGVEIIEQNDQKISLKIAAGESWHELVRLTVENQWQGIETMALIPGFVGASPVQNIGAYGSEVKDVLIEVRAFDTQVSCFVTLKNEQCDFSYRDSVFKRNPGRYIITFVVLELQKTYTEKNNYTALNDYFVKNDISDKSLKNVFDAICAIRQMKLPDPEVIANAGSFFKNPCISQSQFDALKTQYPNIVGYKIAAGEVKLAAGWLIDDCGWRGFQADAIGVYEKQALVLIHTGGGTLNQLLAVAEQIKKSVFEKFSVHLEIEPQHFPL